MDNLPYLIRGHPRWIKGLVTPTLTDVTLRDAIDGLLENSDPGVDPSAALAEAGFGDVSPELFGTALSHFADSAPLPTADALAPIVTRVGPVPFEESDLPEADLEPGLDPFDLFAEVNPDPAAFVNVEPEVQPGVDDDPSDLDIETPADAPSVPSVEEGSHFGSGVDDAVDEADDDLDDLRELNDFDVADEPAEVASFGPDEEFDDGFDQLEGGDELLDEGADLFSVEFDDAADDGADPLDLDFDA